MVQLKLYHVARCSELRQGVLPRAAMGVFEGARTTKLAVVRAVRRFMPSAKPKYSRAHASFKLHFETCTDLCREDMAYDVSPHETIALLHYLVILNRMTAKLS